MLKTMKWALLGMVIGGVAYAVSEKQVDKYGGAFPMWLDKGLYVGTAARNPTASTGNKVTGIWSGTMVNDFPAVTGQHGCVASARSATVTGCRFGDTVSMGIDQVVNADLTILPYVSAANAIKAYACANGITDGGTADMPDASYTFTCVSHQ